MTSVGGPDVSVVVVSFNTCDLLRDCLRTITREAGAVRYELIVVDNASHDGSAEMVAAEFPGARLVRNAANLGFAAASNRGFAIANGRHVALLHSDAFLGSGALARSVERMDADRRVGVAGGRLTGRDGAWQPSARPFPSLANDFLALSGLATRYPQSPVCGRFDRTWANHDEPAKVDWVTAAYCIIRRDVLHRVGLFDERFFLHCADTDLCHRIKAVGYTVWYWPDVVVMHLGDQPLTAAKPQPLSAAGAQATLNRARGALLYYRKHHGSFVAWLAYQQTVLWHAGRAWNYSRRSDPDSQSTAAAARAVVALQQQAWQETQGGQVPPVPPP